MAFRINTGGLKFRLGILVFAALAGLALLGSIQAFHLRTQMMNDRKQTLVAAVDLAVSTAKSFQKLESQGALSREEAQKRARDTLRDMRFFTDEYYYPECFTNRLIPPSCSSGCVFFQPTDNPAPFFAHPNPLSKSIPLRVMLKFLR